MLGPLIVEFSGSFMNFMQKRFEELSSRAAQRYYTAFSDFLTMEEQSELLSLRLESPFKLFGGYEGAERCVAAFGEDCENDDFPISYIKIEPVAKKFADKLTHRDFLGSLMNLGIKRETLGDIIIKDNTGYLMCLDTVADFIANDLTRVKHTSVKCNAVSYTYIYSERARRNRRRSLQSLRIDVLTAAVYNLSRNCGKRTV